MRRACVCLATVVGLLGTATAANAAKPVIVGGDPVQVDIQFPAGVVCDFGVDIHLETKTRLITFVDGSGNPTRGISVGRIHVWESNAETGATVFSSISGPSFFDAAGALVRGTGAWSGIVLQDGTWIHARGLITFDANGLVSEVRGFVEPVCDALD